MPRPFSSFMAEALYHPQRGYYTHHIRSVGARGDFSTTPTLTPALGQRIAAWLRTLPRTRHIIEIGAGGGHLMQQVQSSLGWWRRRTTHFHIVEVSPVLRKQQQQLLRGVTWHDSIQSALAAAGGEAHIYHHELLDAFPATLIEWRDHRWHEVCVPEALVPLQIDPQPYSALQHTHFTEGQRCEIHPSIRSWLQNWASHWKSGSMLTIDYGEDFPDLYRRRPAGTLRAYFMHQRLYWPDLLQNPGRMDLTADINFTDYRAWCRELGWTELNYQTMAQWAAHGHPEGAGGAFKCLVHRTAHSPI